MKALTSSEEIPVSIVTRPESIPAADCERECEDFLVGEDRPSNSRWLDAADNGGSGNSAKSAALGCGFAGFGNIGISGDVLKEVVVGDRALDMGEQCEDDCSKSVLEKSRPMVDRSTKAEGGKSGSEKDVGGMRGADPGGDGILEVPLDTDRSSKMS